MFIAVEGCFGAGKSTVAMGLAEFRKADLLLENFEANPFLPAFYENPRDYAVETEFAFLLLHFHQLKRHFRISQTAEVIADFHLGKDLLYAGLNLNEMRLKRIFNQLYDLCLETIPRPHFMICLSASTELLTERIRSRSRTIESNIDHGYLEAINASYEDFFREYPGPKLILPAGNWDFVKNPSLFERLSSAIDKELGAA